MCNATLGDFDLRRDNKTATVKLTKQVAAMKNLKLFSLGTVSEVLMKNWVNSFFRHLASFLRFETSTSPDNVGLKSSTDLCPQPFSGHVFSK